MRMLISILKGAHRSFEGRLWWRFVMVVGMAILAGVTAGFLPAIIGHAVGAIAGGSAVPGRSPAGFGRIAALLMPSDTAWVVIVITLLATIVSVGITVWSSKTGSALSGDVTAAVRIEVLGAVLHASPRDTAKAGEAIVAAHKGGPAPAGVKPGPAPAGVKPGPAPPGVKPGAPAVKGNEVVKLAIARESAVVSDFAVAVISGLPQSVATLVILGFELAASDAWFALLGGIALFVSSRLLADRASRRVGKARRSMQTTDAAVFGDLQEKLSATEDLRLWGARRQAVGEFARVARDCAAARARFAAALAVAGQIKSVFMAMSPLLIIVALKLSGRDYDAGEVAKLLLVVPLLMGRLEALDALRTGLLEREPLLKAVVGLLALPSAPKRSPHPRQVSPAEVAGRVVFDGVSYQPPGATRPIIDDVSFEVPPGAVVGICGPSGSGKSSLLRLLLRLDDPDGGHIVLDRCDLSEIEPDQLPELFGVVRQTSQLLQRSVRDNLSLGLDPRPSDEAMADALVRVDLRQLVDSGHDERDLSTEYHANPPNFSGGEVRRLLLARLLVSDSRVWVLDEPEAGLPSGTAEQILATVVEQAAGRTLIVVTHAPHVLASDFNVVMDRGRVVARGTHEQLLSECEAYRRLLAEAFKE